MGLVLGSVLVLAAVGRLGTAIVENVRVVQQSDGEVWPWGARKAAVS